jgi:Protein of unknown function (DUF2752)
MMYLSQFTISKKLQLVGVCAGCLAAGIGLYVMTPGPGGILPPCPFYTLTGYYCIGCGTVRALHQLLHGNVGGAFGYNPLMMVALPFMVYAFVSLCMEVLWGRSLPKLFSSNASGVVLLCIAVAYWVLRNVPVYPLTLLAPHAS